MDEVKDDEVNQGPLLSNQELYSKVRKHLLTQMQKSLSHTGACLYRSKNGLRCGIGVLIPDNLYTPAMEGKSVAWAGSDTVNNYLVVRAANIQRSQLSLAYDLQRVHDGSDPPLWAGELNWLAAQHHLNPE